MHLREITQRKDIDLLVRTFYTKALKDPLIGEFFTNVVKLDFDKHMPIMIDFWESVLFGAGNYAGNPIKKHIDLSQKKKLTSQHFLQWLALWNQTVDELFIGEKAVEVRQKAKLMGELMQYKIAESDKPNFIQ